MPPVRYPACAANGSAANHHPAPSHSGGKGTDETDAIVISVVVVIILFVAVFGSLAYSRASSGRRLEAMHALSYLNEPADSDDDLFNPDDVGVGGDPDGAGSRLHLATTVYEGDNNEGFDPSVGEDYRYA
jgi:hypothetical protein